MFDWFRKRATVAPTSPVVPQAPSSDEHKARGNAFFAEGRLDEAAASYRAAIAADHSNAAAHYNLGMVLHAAGHLVDAAKALSGAWRADPSMADAQKLLATLCLAQGDLPAAVTHARLAVATDPGCGAQGELCMALFQQGEAGEAAQVITEGLARQPDNPRFHFFQGNLHMHAGRPADAADSYQRAIALDAGDTQVHLNLGIALVAERRWQEAAAAYANALALPGGATARVYNNLGIAQSAQGRYEEALASFGRALALEPALADALSNRAMMLGQLQRLDEATAAFENLLQAAPDFDYALGFLLGSKSHACDWSGRDELLAQASEAIADGRRAIVPFALLGLSDSPQLQWQCSRTYATHKYSPAAQPLWRGERYGHDRIRVAYLSADFHDHATAYLMAELFERHDRTCFDTFALSFGPISSGAMRQRLEPAFGRFIEVGNLTDASIANLVRELKIDIAIDLKGHTTDARPAIFAHRPAPVQVNYIGFPGTMGADYIDYIIGDHQLFEPEDARWYTERLVRLPESYQPNDAHRRIAATPTRAQLSLPETAFVFCCFNNNYKITPEVFSVWMRLLAQVEGSVLWLLEDNPIAARNLRREAEARGVSSGRLVFAGRMPLDEHLARQRQRQADLFLDTLPCNAHTTASDALWAGLPVLTCRGQIFAARVAASLLQAAGLPELITHSLQDYEALALELARSPDRLQVLKSKLAANRASCPLFDADRLRRHLESAYTTMWSRSEAGLPAEGFDVVALPAAG